MTSPRLHQLIERLSSLFRASFRQTATTHGLKLVQLEALTYLSMANGYSDTPVALTEYLGVTKGTVSQTLAALERRELVVKAPDPEDGRAVRLRLTQAGGAVAAEAYPTPLVRDLPDAGRGDATDALEALLRTIQQNNGHRSFGVCRTCRFFEVRGQGGRCGLTGEPLRRRDLGLICREHEVPSLDP